MNGQDGSRQTGDARRARTSSPNPRGPADWFYFQAAERALRKRAQRQRELSFDAVAATVLRVLPTMLRRRLAAALAAVPTDRALPYDFLDCPNCPAALTGDLRPLAQLALFGLPGQGTAWRDKHRDDVYQRLTAEIMTSAVDPVSLQSTANRALNHPDVASDPTLAARLRAFIAERERALHSERRTPAEEHEQASHASKLRLGFRAFGSGGPPTKNELLDMLSRTQREFEASLAQFEEPRALRALDRIRELRQKYPVHIPQADLQRAEEQYDRLLKRAGAYRRQIRELSQKGAAAALAGDDKTSTWVIRRLQAIHRLLPMLLGEDDLATQLTLIRGASDAHDEEEVVQELAQRKRDVVSRIKNLAGIVHRYHQISVKLPADDPVHQRAATNYRQALDEIRTMNTEWLSGLVIELETLLDDLDDPEGAMQNQLDQFVNNVRGALNRLCLEIRARQKAARAANQRSTDPKPPGASSQSA